GWPLQACRAARAPARGRHRRRASQQDGDRRHEADAAPGQQSARTRRGRRAGDLSSGMVSAKPAPSTRSAYRAFQSVATRWMDNDIYGHLNNVVHYSLFDTAVNGWLIGQGVLDMHKGAQIGVVVETGCRYFSEMAFPDSVTAGIRVSRLGTSSVRYEIGLFRNDED